MSQRKTSTIMARICFVAINGAHIEVYWLIQKKLQKIFNIYSLLDKVKNGRKRVSEENVDKKTWTCFLNQWRTYRNFLIHEKIKSVYIQNQRKQGVDERSIRGPVKVKTGRKRVSEENIEDYRLCVLRISSGAYNWWGKKTYTLNTILFSLIYLFICVCNKCLKL